MGILIVNTFRPFLGRSVARIVFKLDFFSFSHARLTQIHPLHFTHKVDVPGKYSRGPLDQKPDPGVPRPGTTGQGNLWYRVGPSKASRQGSAVDGAAAFCG